LTGRLRPTWPVGVGVAGQGGLVRARWWSVEPGAHFLVDGGVVEELEVDKAAEVLAVADGERDVASASAPPVGAGGLAERSVRAAGHGGADGVVVGGSQQREVVAVVFPAHVRVAVGPVLVEQRAEAQVVDGGTASREPRGEGERLLGLGQGTAPTEASRRRGAGRRDRSDGERPVPKARPWFGRSGRRCGSPTIPSND
jgi:hypothetical protein